LIKEQWITKHEKRERADKEEPLMIADGERIKEEIDEESNGISMFSLLVGIVNKTISNNSAEMKNKAFSMISILTKRLHEEHETRSIDIMGIHQNILDFVPEDKKLKDTQHKLYKA